MARRRSRSTVKDPGAGLLALALAVVALYLAYLAFLYVAIGALTAVRWVEQHTAVVVGSSVLVLVAAGTVVILFRRRSPPAPELPRPVAYSREPIPAGLRFAVLRRDGFRCAYCGRGQEDGVQLHIDHLVPVAGGGRNELDNLVTACASCNLGKSASDLVGRP